MRAVACVHVDLLASPRTFSHSLVERSRESLFLAQLYVDLFFALLLDMPTGMSLLIIPSGREIILAFPLYSRHRTYLVYIPVVDLNKIYVD